ncbi:DUF5684 domain-containing protein [Agromyces sp. H3Y2-19a]|uniref:DUF5684 domain-containing protein n=1 Tax=Agromyces chromiiresistens TaxID=3030835 RepID=UPI0023B8CA11|nr:DUF5684 domain-containing protein [Agromyces chromiiresistens]MDF0512409.1 DUF5684 domain-containing protein [Agromyces chromiiresistens]
MFLTESQTNPGDVFAVFVPLMLFYGLLFVFAIATYVLMAIFLSKVFVKTGNEGWPAWVPVYSSWRVLEIAGFQGWIALLSFVPFGNIVALVFLIMAVNRINKGFGRSAGWTVLYVFLPLIWGALMGYGRTEPWRGPAAWLPEAGYYAYPPQAQPYPGAAQAQPYPGAPPAQAQSYPPQPAAYPPAAPPAVAAPAAPAAPEPPAPPVPPAPPAPPAPPVPPTDPNQGA